MKNLTYIMMLVLTAGMFTSCQKPENFFVGDWHHHTGEMEDGVTCDIYLHIQNNSQFNLDNICTRGSWNGDSHASGSWTLVNDEQITATVYYENGETRTWTFRKDGKTLYWVEGKFEFHK